MNVTLLNEYPHRRGNPLTGEWVLVSPHRTDRPWQGLEEKGDPESLPPHDPACYLCPGNPRTGGSRNPLYRDVHVFTNDYPALLPDPPASPKMASHTLFQADRETGTCRVICYHPRHDLSLARMEPREVDPILEAWRREYLDLGRREDIGHVQIFENRGLMMGCSNPHPHGQIWATRSVPTLPAMEGDRQKSYRSRHGGCLLCDYLDGEGGLNERMVLYNESFVVLVPFWAVWPFETMILPRRHGGSIADLSPRERSDMAEVMVRLAVRYDNLFETPFPYSMGLHQEPTDGRIHREWHWHMHYLPPLLRSPSVRKFMVGFEMLAMPQRDLTAEDCAGRLRILSESHYRERTAP